MAINTDGWMNDDAPQSRGKGSGGATSLAAGHELAVAIAGQMQLDALALASLAEQYTATKERLADQLAPLFNEALGGQGLMGAVMARLTVQPITINTTIEPIDISSLLPKPTDSGLVERFLAFSAGIQPPALHLPAAYGGTDED